MLMFKPNVLLQLKYWAFRYHARCFVRHRQPVDFKLHFQVFDDYDVIVNCAGIGSHVIARDSAIQPIRGQVIKVSVA